MTTELAIAELIKHPNLMEKAQEEVRRLVGRKPKVEVENLHQVRYLKCIIKETLRLHPPGPLLAPRESNANATIHGYLIPPKTRVIINAWAILQEILRHGTVRRSFFQRDLPTALLILRAMTFNSFLLALGGGCVLDHHLPSIL